MAVGAAFVVVTLAGGAFVFLGWLGLLGKLPPNHFAGIRTPFTRASEENWYVTHRAAGPILVFGGVAVFAAGLSGVPFALLGKLPAGFGLPFVTALTVVLVVTAIVSWQVGVGAAKRQR
jgi:uncharacterized membrane protein